MSELRKKIQYSKIENLLKSKRFEPKLLFEDENGIAFVEVETPTYRKRFLIDVQAYDVVVDASLIERDNIHETEGKEEQVNEVRKLSSGESIATISGTHLYYLNKSGEVTAYLINGYEDTQASEVVETSDQNDVDAVVQEAKEVLGDYGSTLPRMDGESSEEIVLDNGDLQQMQREYSASVPTTGGDPAYGNGVGNSGSDSSEISDSSDATVEFDNGDNESFSESISDSDMSEEAKKKVPETKEPIDVSNIVVDTDYPLLGSVYFVMTIMEVFKQIKLDPKALENLIVKSYVDLDATKNNLILSKKDELRATLQEAYEALDNKFRVTQGKIEENKMKLIKLSNVVLNLEGKEGEKADSLRSRVSIMIDEINDENNDLEESIIEFILNWKQHLDALVQI